LDENYREMLGPEIASTPFREWGRGVGPMGVAHTNQGWKPLAFDDHIIIIFKVFSFEDLVLSRTAIKQIYECKNNLIPILSIIQYI